MTWDKKVFDWFDDLMWRRPLMGFIVIFSAVIIFCTIIGVPLFFILGDGEQKQIEFTNACNDSGRTAVLHYEEYQSGKTRGWKPIVECK